MDDSEKQQKPWRHKRKHSAKKKWLVIGVVAIILIAGGVGGWWIIYNGGNQPPKIISRTDAEIGTLMTSVVDMQDSGDTKGALVKLNEVINQTKASNQKYDLLYEKATLYYNEGKYTDAMSTIKEVEAITSDAAVAEFIASLYRKMGDTQKAIEYYQKAISLLDKNLDSYQSDLEYNQSRIDDLNGVIK